MSVGAPLGLLALGALVPLALVYWLRRRQPPRLVSAAFLWRSPSPRAEAGPRLERFSRELSFLLEALAVATAALFLAEVGCAASARGSHLVVVVDGSLSLRARGPDGVEVAARVRDAVRSLADEREAAWLTVVESGLVPSVLAGPRKDVAGALAALERWSPSRPRHDLGPALSLARELAGDDEGSLFLFTDGPVKEAETLPPNTTVQSVGAARDNVALVSARRRDDAAGATLTLGVASFSSARATVALRVSDAEGRILQTVDLALEPGVAALTRVAARAAGPLRISLPDDALPEDGVVTLWPNPEQPVEARILPGLDATTERAVRDALAAVAHLAPTPVDPTRAERPALVVGAPGSGASVQVGAQGALASYLGPFFARREHPLLDDVAFEGVVWTAGENPPGRPLVRAGAATLLAEAHDGTLHLNVALARSNVQRSEAWPVLWANAARRVRAEAPGFSRQNPTLGERLAVTVPRSERPDEVVRWSLRDASGRERPLLGTGAIPLPPLEQPGRLELLRNGELVDRVEVASLDPAESDLRSRAPFTASGTPGSTPAARTSSAGAPLGGARAWWLLWAMLALVLADAWWLSRPQRGSA